MEMWVLTTKLLQWYFLMPAFVGSAALHNGRTALFAQNHGTNWIAERSSAARRGRSRTLHWRHEPRPITARRNNAHHTTMPPPPPSTAGSSPPLCFTRYTLICRENYIVSLTECFWVISLIVAGITSTWNVRPGFHNGTVFTVLTAGDVIPLWNMTIRLLGIVV